MRGRSVALLLSAALLFYVLTLGDQGLTLIRDGRPAFVVLGVAVLVLPVLGAWVIVRELRFGAAAERLGRELEAEGGLPVDDLPRDQRGRIDRDAADAAFEARRAEVEAAPEDWRAWYRLAVAYGDAGDTPRGRRAMRRAILLHRSSRRPV